MSPTQEPRHGTRAQARIGTGIDRLVGQRSFAGKVLLATQRRQQQLVLRAEMPEERHLVHVRLFGDAPRGGATEARLLEDAQGGIQNSVLGRHRVAW